MSFSIPTGSSPLASRNDKLSVISTRVEVTSLQGVERFNKWTYINYVSLAKADVT